MTDSQCVQKQCEHFAYYSERLFPIQLPSHWSINMQRCCGSDLNSVLARLPCCFSNGPAKHGFLDICLRTFSGIRNFGNTSAMRVIFLLKFFKTLCTFQKCRKNVEKKIFLLEINASQLATWNCLYYWENTSDLQSMC